MAGFDFRAPNLLEVALIIGFLFNLVFGWLLISKAVEFPLEGIQAISTALTAIFVWLATIWLGVIALILEYTRVDLKELKEQLKK